MGTISITYLIILDFKSFVIYVHMFNRTSRELEAHEMLLKTESRSDQAHIPRHQSWFHGDLGGKGGEKDPNFVRHFFQSRRLAGTFGDLQNRPSFL